MSSRFQIGPHPRRVGDLRRLGPTTRMEQSGHSWWRWTRGTLAIVLTLLLIGLVFSCSSRVVTYRLHQPLTYDFMGRLQDSLPGIALALVSLGCVFLGMWKRWDFEIVGWVLLIVFILVGIVF